MTARRRVRWRVVPKSLRARVTVLAALAVLGLLAVASVGLVLAQRGALVQALDESLDRQADAVARQLRDGGALRARDLPSDDVVVEVLGPDGSLLAASDSPDGRLPRNDRDLEEGGATTVELADGEAGRLLAKDVEGGTVLVAGSLDDVRDAMAALSGTLVVAVPLTGVVLAGVVWWAVGRALRPVEGIRARVEEISGNRLNVRVPEPASDDEIARLARTMNAMLDRLQRSAEQQRRFVADASHELRSPLTRMRTELEVDTAHPGSADAAATAASVLAETVTLQGLVDDLLLLARADAGVRDPVQQVPVDLDDVVQPLAARARATGAVAIDTRGVRPVQVPGNAGQLGRAVANLVDNAVRHARSRVTVTLAENGDGEAVLAVADDGPGIPAPDHDRVFERFTRLDDARTAGSGGAGLGLAIARDIAERHGGTLTLDSDATGARFVLRLPVARAAKR